MSPAACFADLSFVSLAASVVSSKDLVLLLLSGFYLIQVDAVYKNGADHGYSLQLFYIV